MQELRDENPFYKNWNELISPERLVVNEESRSNTFGKFSCQPLERGFAITIGNALRRILLSSIRGVAITSIRIGGAQHEFTTIEGVKEDVADIILNLKQVRLKLNSSDSSVAVIDKKGPCTVKACDIVGSAFVEIMNPDQHVCTITGNSSLRIELNVEWGKGYSPAEQHKSENQLIGTIPIDATFSPIKRIAHIVSQARVGQQTDYDKLTMEIETDGSVYPENALAYAAKILKEQLDIFINFDESKVVEPDFFDGSLGNEPEFPSFLDKNVEDLELSVRSANCLKNAEISFIGQLVQKTDAEMLKTKNFGRKSLNEIKSLLSEHELTLGMNIDGWIPPNDRECAGDANSRHIPNMS